MFYGREMEVPMSGLGSSAVHFTLGFLLCEQLGVTLVGVRVCVCVCVRARLQVRMCWGSWVCKVSTL